LPAEFTGGSSLAAPVYGRYRIEQKIAASEIKIKKVLMRLNAFQIKDTNKTIEYIEHLFFSVIEEFLLSAK